MRQCSNAMPISLCESRAIAVHQQSMHLEAMRLHGEFLFPFGEHPSTSFDRLMNKRLQILRRLASTRKHNVIGITCVRNIALNSVL
ncbi:hypothetical protein WI23_13430 [Burkholderia oklahomensis C6786]|nr:hypothetical protein WI23_13430 [Burkholderia oklahomensis C6786]KUY62872.1 hypothetical protein WI23_08325 [Burkholderia oklahomensis C6786]